MAESAPFTANMRPAWGSLNCSFVTPTMWGNGMPMRNASGPTTEEVKPTHVKVQVS